MLQLTVLKVQFPQVAFSKTVKKVFLNLPKWVSLKSDVTKTRKNKLMKHDLINHLQSYVVVGQIKLLQSLQVPEQSEEAVVF